MTCSTWATTIAALTPVMLAALAIVQQLLLRHARQTHDEVQAVSDRIPDTEAVIGWLQRRTDDAGEGSHG